MDTDKKLGLAGENLAASYLKKHGYTVLARNFNSRIGEIDIVARERETIVFIEVKTRRSLKRGYPSEAVGRQKQHKLKLMAQSYLARFGLWEQPCRFDVIEVMPGTDTWHVRHIVNAFI